MIFAILFQKIDYLGTDITQKLQQNFRMMENINIRQRKMRRVSQESSRRRDSRLSDLTCDVMVPKYEIMELVGKGTFGRVYRAQDKEQKVYAIKVVEINNHFKNREQQIIKFCNHFNVIEYVDSFETIASSSTCNRARFLNIVMPYLPSSLLDFLKFYRSKKIPVPEWQVKIITFQMFKILDYFESLKLCHRDLKPQNILIDSKTCQIKVCDFGSAKFLKTRQSNITYICSRYYRAPELLLGMTGYSTEVDVWSVGCILVQLLTIQPLFPGESTFEQLIEIVKILGSPSEKLLARCTANVKFPEIKPCGWKRILKKYKPSALFIDLLEKTLLFDPHQRIKPSKALAHPFFADLCIDEKCSEAVKKLPYIFDFSKNPKLHCKQLLQSRFTINKNVKLQTQTPPTQGSGEFQGFYGKDKIEECVQVQLQ